MSLSGRLYGFGLLFAWAAELFARVVEDELAAERAVAVSLKGLICGLDFSSKDSVNEFIGVNRLSYKSSAIAAENAPRNAIINRILVCMYLEIGHWSLVVSYQFQDFTGSYRSHALPPG
jgi:hypothetical protein